MLHLHTIRELEDYFHERKRITLDAIGRDPSDAVADIYIKGFLRSILEKIGSMCPEVSSSLLNAQPSPHYRQPSRQGLMHQARLYSEPTAVPERVLAEKQAPIAQPKELEPINNHQIYKQKSKRPALMEDGQLKPELNSTFQSQMLDDAESAPVNARVRESQQFQNNMKKQRTVMDIEVSNMTQTQSIGNNQLGSKHRQGSEYSKLENKLQARQIELQDHINKVEENTADITNTTVALRNKTEELAATQDEILRRIIALQENRSSVAPTSIAEEDPNIAKSLTTQPLTGKTNNIDGKDNRPNLQTERHEEIGPIVVELRESKNIAINDMAAVNQGNTRPTPDIRDRPDNSKQESNRGSTEFEPGKLVQRGHGSRPLSVTSKGQSGFPTPTPGQIRVNSRGSRRSNLSNKEKEFRDVGDYRDRIEFERRKQAYEDNERARNEQALASIAGTRGPSGQRNTYKSEPRGVLGAAGRNTMQLKSQNKSEYRAHDGKPKILVDYASPGYGPGRPRETGDLQQPRGGRPGRDMKPFGAPSKNYFERDRNSVSSVSSQRFNEMIDAAHAISGNQSTVERRVTERSGRLREPNIEEQKVRSFNEKSKPFGSSRNSVAGQNRRFDIDQSILNEEQDAGNFDEAEINVEVEQGKSQNAGKLQYALLKQSAPQIHCQYFGQAARHINMIDDDHILITNLEHKVDVFKRGDPRKVKTLDIEYMRYSLVNDNLLFIGTEEKMLYMLDALTFEILDRFMTQSYIFTLCMIDKNTIVCGEYQGHVDVLRIKQHEQLIMVHKQALVTGTVADGQTRNIYKIVKAEKPDEFAFGCGNGMYFAKWENDKFHLHQDKIFAGKYVTQIVPLPRGAYLISIWNQAGVFIVDRSPKNKPLKIEDPRYNSHITDLKPLFPDQFQELPYVVARNKNAINLVDLRNRHIQPLIEIKNSDLFCEKLCHRVDNETGQVCLIYVTWQNDKTFVKEIELPDQFIDTLRSAADL